MKRESMVMPDIARVAILRMRDSSLETDVWDMVLLCFESELPFVAEGSFMSGESDVDDEVGNPS